MESKGCGLGQAGGLSEVETTIGHRLTMQSQSQWFDCPQEMKEKRRGWAGRAATKGREQGEGQAKVGFERVETTNNKAEMWLNKQRLHSRCADVLAERSPGVAGWGFGEAETQSGEVRMRRVEER
jgi:hypothetical protein